MTATFVLPLDDCASAPRLDEERYDVPGRCDLCARLRLIDSGFQRDAVSLFYSYAFTYPLRKLNVKCIASIPRIKS